MTRLTTEQFEAIRERAEKATTGSWYTEITTFGDNTYVHVQPGIAQDANEADAEFIANAREDIPALLAEVERLKAQLCEAESLLSEAHGIMDDVHLYDTELFTEITRYLYGEEDA